MLAQQGAPADKRADNAAHASRGLRDARTLLIPLVEKNIAEARHWPARSAFLSANREVHRSTGSDAREKTHGPSFPLSLRGSFFCQRNFTY
jgi:hypothetical protein